MALYANLFQKYEKREGIGIEVEAFIPENKSERRLLENMKSSMAFLPEEEYWLRDQIVALQSILDNSENDKELTANIKKILTRKAKLGYGSALLHYLLDISPDQRIGMIEERLQRAKNLLYVISLKYRG